MNAPLSAVAQPLRILIAAPRGFCAGVERAIRIVERALELHGAPIYVRHEIVHNKHVVDSLRRQGAVFVDELAEVPAGATVIFSAHGVSRAIKEEAGTRGLNVFDATCPLVTKVHVEVSKMRAEGREPALIGPSPGFTNLRWLKPVTPGDAISYRSTVTGTRELNSRPGWGLVFSMNEGFNQKGELVFSFEGKVLTPKRP